MPLFKGVGLDPPTEQFELLVRIQFGCRCFDFLYGGMFEEYHSDTSALFVFRYFVTRMVTFFFPSR
jgi:hypothetical protein